MWLGSRCQTSLAVSGRVARIRRSHAGQPYQKLLSNRQRVQRWTDSSRRHRGRGDSRRGWRGRAADHGSLCCDVGFLGLSLQGDQEEHMHQSALQANIGCIHFTCQAFRSRRPCCPQGFGAKTPAKSGALVNSTSPRFVRPAAAPAMSARPSSQPCRHAESLSLPGFPHLFYFPASSFMKRSKT